MVPLATSPRLRGEVGSRSDLGEGDYRENTLVEIPPLPSESAFTPVFDRPCGETECTKLGARMMHFVALLLEFGYLLNPSIGGTEPSGGRSCRRGSRAGVLA